MSKKILVAVLCLGLIVILNFSASPPGSSPGFFSTTPSLEENICTKVATKYGECKKVILIDIDSNVAFAETGSGILPVLISKDQNKMVKIIYPELNFQEFREEKEETGPITWRIENNVQKDFSIIYRFARNNAKTIIINSEGKIQPNKLLVRDDLAGMTGGSGAAALWAWYVTSKDEMNKPMDVTVYGADGHIIYGGGKED